MTLEVKTDVNVIRGSKFIEMQGQRVHLHPGSDLASTACKRGPFSSVTSESSQNKCNQC